MSRRYARRWRSVGIAMLAACGDNTGPGPSDNDRLAGPAGDPAVAAIERELYEPRAEDFSLGHPDLPGMLLSHRVAIVAIGTAATVEEVNALLDELDAEIAGGIPGVPAQAAALLALRLQTTTHAEMDGALATIRSRPFVESVSQDMELGTTEVTDQNDGAPPAWVWDSTGVLQTWGLIAIRAPQMWNLNQSIRAATQPPVLTGVLDNGFAEGHQDLPLFQYIGVRSAGSHGTHVSGTIGATFNNKEGIDGVNPFTALVVRKYDNSISTYAGAMWGLDDLIIGQPGLRVVNLSLGYNWYQSAPVVDARTNPAAQLKASTHGAQIRTALAALTAQGYRLPFIAAAAGNDSQVLPTLDAKFGSPFANAALALGVAAIVVVEADSLAAGAPAAYTRSIFSNVGGHVSAPGSLIWSTDVGAAGYGVKSGTSMATPHVAGLAGFLYALAPDLPSPTLTANPVRDLLIANLQPGVRNGRPQVDAFASALAVDGLLGGDAVLRRLLDLDDGTADGNLRVNAAGAINTSENRAADNGRIDMADFRRWRDWLLQVENPAGLALDGAVTHPKKDPNGDGAGGGAPAYEALYSRGDFNGDGKLHRAGTRAVPGVLGGQVLTDLQVLQHLFQDATYATADLPGLIASGDLHVDASTCLAANGAVSVRVTVLAATTPVLPPRLHAAATSLQVYTVPAPGGYTVRSEALNTTGAVVASEDGALHPQLGGDLHWRPTCSGGGGGSAQLGTPAGSLSALTQFQGQFLCSDNHSAAPATSPSPAAQCISSGQVFDDQGNPRTSSATANSQWTFQSTAAANGQPASFAANLGTSASADFRTWGAAEGVLTLNFTVTGAPMRYEITGTLSASGPEVTNWDGYARVLLIHSGADLVDLQAGRRNAGSGIFVSGPPNLQLNRSGTLQPGTYTFQVVNRVGDISTSFHTDAASGAAANNPTLTLRPD